MVNYALINHEWSGFNIITYPFSSGGAGPRAELLQVEGAPQRTVGHAEQDIESPGHGLHCGEWVWVLPLPLASVADFGPLIRVFFWGKQPSEHTLKAGNFAKIKYLNLENYAEVFCPVTSEGKFCVK